MKLDGRSGYAIAAEIHVSVEQSRRPRHVDRVDWLMFHGAWREQIDQLPRLFAPLEILCEQGKVRWEHTSTTTRSRARLENTAIEFDQVTAIRSLARPEDSFLNPAHWLKFEAQAAETPAQ